MKCCQWAPWHGAGKVTNPPELQSSQKLWFNHNIFDVNATISPVPCIDHLSFGLGTRDPVSNPIWVFDLLVTQPLFNWVFSAEMWNGSPTLQLKWVMCIALNWPGKCLVPLYRFGSPKHKKAHPFTPQGFTSRLHQRDYVWITTQRSSDPEHIVPLSVLFFKSPGTLWAIKYGGVNLKELTQTQWFHPRKGCHSCRPISLLGISPVFPSQKLLFCGCIHSLSHQAWLLGRLEGTGSFPSLVTEFSAHLPGGHALH